MYKVWSSAVNVVCLDWISYMKKDINNSPSVSGNYLLNTLVSILGLIVPLITTPYISRTLGAEAIGTYNYCYSIEMYFAAMGQMGVPIYARREIAKARNNPLRLNQVYCELLTLQLGCVFTAMVVYLAAIQFMRESFRLMFLICGIEMVTNLFNVSWLFIGLEDFKSIAKRDIVFRLLNVLLVFTVVKKPEDISKYAFSMMFTGLLCSLFLFVLAGKRIKFAFASFKKTFHHLRPALLLMLPGMVTIIYAVIDSTMIGTITGDMAQVGYYEQSQKLVKVALAILTSMGTVLLPRLSALFGQQDMVRFKSFIIKAVSAICFIAIPLAVGYIAVSDDVVPWFYGEGYDYNRSLLKVFAPMMIFMGISDLVGSQIFVATNREYKLLLINIVSVAVNFGLNLLLIPKYLALGAAAATVISEFLKCAMSMYVSRKFISSAQFVRDIVKYGIASGVMYVVVVMVRHALPVVNTVFSTALMAFSGVSVYVVLLALVKDPWILRGAGMIKKFIYKFLPNKY